MNRFICVAAGRVTPMRRLVNANNAYKDSLRCDEIEARRRMNSEGTDE